MELADTISRASSASTADLQDIVLSAKYAAAPLSKLGRTTKEMAAFSALMAQVGLQGETGGRAVREFFQRVAKFKEFQDAKGNLISTEQILAKLRQRFEGLGDAQLTKKLNKIFGELGSQAAIALLKEGVGSYESMVEAMDNAIGVQDKLTESMKGFNKQINALKGTSRSVIANLFLPALDPLTKAVKKMNEFVTLIGDAAEKKKAISEIVSKGSLGAVAVGGAATIGLAGAGLFYGRKVLKGVGGIKGLFKGAGGTAAGIAAGKAVEAATGVQPVFVTNWPAGFGTGGALASTAAGMLGGGKLLNSAKILLSRIGVAGAGLAIGWGAGRVIDKKFIEGSRLGLVLDGLADKIANWWTGISDIEEETRKLKEKLQLKIENNIHIDKDGRVITETNHMGTETKTHLQRGRF